MGEPRSFDRIADRYDETRGGVQRGRLFAADIAPLFSGRGPTLEIGIGTGIVAKGLVGLGRPVVGIDIAPLMLRYAYDRLGPRVAVGNAECLPIRDGSIDSAYSVWVFHLIEVPVVLREVRRALRAGGRYIVCVFIPPASDPIQDIVAPMFEALGGGKKRRDDPDAVMAAALECGFSGARSHTGARQTSLQSPASAAGRIEARDGAAFWDLDDQQWEQIVAPAIRALRALPDPEREIEQVVRPRILVLER